MNRNQDWDLKQLVAGKSRYYGDGGTIHNSTVLNVETHHGTVVAVWFRCSPLAFTQHESDAERATSMEAMYGNEKRSGGYRLTGVELAEG